MQSLNKKTECRRITTMPTHNTSIQLDHVYSIHQHLNRSSSQLATLPVNSIMFTDCYSSTHLDHVYTLLHSQSTRSGFKLVTLALSSSKGYSSPNSTTVSNRIILVVIGNPASSLCTILYISTTTIQIHLRSYKSEVCLITNSTSISKEYHTFTVCQRFTCFSK